MGRSFIAFHQAKQKRQDTQGHYKQHNKNKKMFKNIAEHLSVYVLNNEGSAHLDSASLSLSLSLTPLFFFFSLSHTHTHFFVLLSLPYTLSLTTSDSICIPRYLTISLTISIRINLIQLLLLSSV